MMLVSPEEIKAEAAKFGQWFHAIELTPGFTTTPFHKIDYLWDMMRTVRSTIPYRGKSVLDVGTNDGMWAFEAEQQRAEMVIAIDNGQYGEVPSKRFAFAKRVLKSNVSCWIADVQEPLPFAGTFDIIQFFGVLYHIEDPIRSLHRLRDVVKPDGLMLLETAVWNDQGPPAVRFNSDLRVYNDATTFWLPNLPCLLAWLKMTGWKTAGGSMVVDSQQTERCCTVCLPV